MANELELANEQALLDYLEELDKKQIQESSGGIFINEIRIISSDKFQEEVGGNKEKGHFVLRVKDESGVINNNYLGASFEGVILKTTTQYTYFDVDENKTLYSTNEFERGVEDRLSVFSHELKETVFRGNQNEFKSWALKHHPAGINSDGSLKHKFKWRAIYYILIPSLIKANGIPASVFRLYLGVKDMDSMNEFNRSLKSAPIRSVVNFTTTKKDVGSTRMYPIKMTVSKNVELNVLMTYVQAKMDLDKALKDYVDSCFIKDIVEDKPLINTPKILNEPNVKLGGIYDGVSNTSNTVIEPIKNKLNPGETSTEDVKNIFGITD